MAKWPPHAYVPGLTSRHAEGWFDTIKASVTQDIAVGELHETDAWQTGLAYLETGFFWECHEVLEAVWLQTPQGSPEREMAQAVIQLANARLKLRMGKSRAVARLCNMVEGHLAQCPQRTVILGLSVPQVKRWIVETRANLA